MNMRGCGRLGAQSGRLRDLPLGAAGTASRSRYDRWGIVPRRALIGGSGRCALCGRRHLEVLNGELSLGSLMRELLQVARSRDHFLQRWWCAGGARGQGPGVSKALRVEFPPVGGRRRGWVRGLRERGSGTSRHVVPSHGNRRVLPRGEVSGRRGGYSLLGFCAVVKVVRREHREYHLMILFDLPVEGHL